MAGWQFWHRGSWSTERTTSKSAMGSGDAAAFAAGAVVGGGPSACEQPTNAAAARSREVGTRRMSRSGQTEGKGAEPLSGHREQRVPDGGCDQRRSRLADAAHLRAALDDVDLDLRHLVHPE